MEISPALNPLHHSFFSPSHPWEGGKKKKQQTKNPTTITTTTTAKAQNTKKQCRQEKWAALQEKILRQITPWRERN